MPVQLNSFKAIIPGYRHIFLSPHFDDVVYSCGGMLGKQAAHGEHPLVITVFAGVPPTGLKLSPFALKIQKAMGFDHNTESLLANRRREDASAISHLRADYLWLDYLDAIYRGSPPYYSYRRSIFGKRRRRSISGKVHHGDMYIVEQLTQELVILHERLPDTIWYAPLGVGYHVDHQIVCSAAQHLLQQRANIIFYEDFPYAKRAGALQKRLRESGNNMKPILTDISETLHLRQEAAEMYASQVKLNFGNKEEMHNAIKEYSFSIHPEKSIPLERSWTY